MSLLVGTRRSLLGVGQAWSPLDVSGLTLWLLASVGTFQDAAMTIPAVLDGDVVGGWEDQSEQGNHATQATTAKKPTLKLTIINGKSVLRFDGADDTLDLPGNIGSYMTASIKNIFLVTNASAEYLIGDASARFEILRTGGLLRALNWDGTYDSADAAFSAAAHIAAVWHESGNLNMALDDGATATDASGNTTLMTGLFLISVVNLGAMLGDIAEIIVYNTVLTAEERENVQDYLNARYSTW